MGFYKVSYWDNYDSDAGKDYYFLDKDNSSLFIKENMELFNEYDNCETYDIVTED